MYILFCSFPQIIGGMGSKIHLSFILMIFSRLDLTGMKLIKKLPSRSRIFEELGVLFLVFVTGWYGHYVYIGAGGTERDFIQNMGLSIAGAAVAALILRWWWGIKHNDSENQRKLDELALQMRTTQAQNSLILELLQQLSLQGANTQTSSLSYTNEATERARAKLAAAGALRTTVKAPPGTLPLTEDELVELGKLSPGSPSIAEMVDEDREERWNIQK